MPFVHRIFLIFAFLSLVVASSELLAAWNAFLREMTFTGEFVTIFESEVGPFKNGINMCHNCDLSAQRFVPERYLNDPRLRKIVETGRLNILRSSWHIPGFWYVENGDPRGLENILVQRFATFLSSAYDAKINVHTLEHDMSNTELAKYVAEHPEDVDMACNMISLTVDRLDGTFFGCSTVPAAPQILLGPGMWTKSGLDPTNAADVTMDFLNNATFTVCYTEGTTFARMVNEVLDKCGKATASSIVDRIAKLADGTCDIVFLDSPVVTHAVSYYAPTTHPNTGSWGEGPVYKDASGVTYYDEVACLFPTGASKAQTLANADLAWHWNRAFETYPWGDRVEHFFGQRLPDLPESFGADIGMIDLASLNYPEGATRWILDKQLLRVAVTNGAALFDDNAGFLPDLAGHFADYLESTYGKKIHVVYHAVDNFSGFTTDTPTASTLLDTCAVDAVVAAVTSTMATYRQSTAGQPFMHGHLGLMVNASRYTDGEVARITALDAPENTICVMVGSTAAQFASRYLPSSTTTLYPTKADLMAAYTAGVCTFRLGDHEVLTQDFNSPAFRMRYDMTQTVINTATWLNSAFWAPLFRLDQTPGLPTTPPPNPGVPAAALTGPGLATLPIACLSVVLGWVITVALVLGLKLLDVKAGHVGRGGLGM